MRVLTVKLRWAVGGGQNDLRMGCEGSKRGWLGGWDKKNTPHTNKSVDEGHYVKQIKTPPPKKDVTKKT